LQKNHCLIKITQLATGLTDKSDAEFHLAQPEITVTAPNGGEKWQIAETHDITWTWQGDLPKVKIEYTVNNGTSWTNIEDSTSNTGTYQWTIPSTPSNECRVKVTDARNSTTSDQSNNVFEIAGQLMFPLFFIGMLAFMLSTLIKNGNGTAVVIVLIGIALLILQEPIYRSMWNVFHNPFDIPRRMNEVIWHRVTLKNRLFLVNGAILFLLLGLYKLQKREKFIK
jgi:hypothetical protein